MTQKALPPDFDAAPGAFFVVLDVDSTLIAQEAIELLAAEAGSLTLVAEITSRAMSGELDFAASLRERVATLTGLSRDTLTYVSTLLTPTPGVHKLIAQVQSRGGYVCAVSGGFHELLDPLAESLGLNFWAANRLELVAGKLTGRVSGQIVDAEAKAAYFRKWHQDSGIPWSKTITIGDGANDLLMMEESALSIAFCAKPIVQERADIAIDVRDMTQVLTLIGLDSD